MTQSRVYYLQISREWLIYIVADRYQNSLPAKIQICRLCVQVGLLCQVHKGRCHDLPNLGGYQRAIIWNTKTSLQDQGNLLSVDLLQR